MRSLLLAGGLGLVCISVTGCRPDLAHEGFVLIQAENQTKEIPASKYVEYKFSIPPRTCILEGKIEGLVGANKDFEAFIMNGENRKNWIAALSARGTESGRKVAWSFNQPIIGPGDWYLIVSNSFSLLSSKTVLVSAKATCPAGEPYPR